LRLLEAFDAPLPFSVPPSPRDRLSPVRPEFADSESALHEQQCSKGFCRPFEKIPHPLPLRNDCVVSPPTPPPFLTGAVALRGITRTVRLRLLASLFFLLLLSLKASGGCAVPELSACCSHQNFARGRHSKISRFNARSIFAFGFPLAGRLGRYNSATRSDAAGSQAPPGC